MRQNTAQVRYRRLDVGYPGVEADRILAKAWGLYTISRPRLGMLEAKPESTYALEAGDGTVLAMVQKDTGGWMMPRSDRWILSTREDSDTGRTAVSIDYVDTLTDAKEILEDKILLALRAAFRV